jgi:cytochrome P450 PksS
MTATVAPELLTDLSEDVMFRDPFPHYARLRREAPVSMGMSQLTRPDVYLATRYDDVMQVHTDPRLSSDVMTYGGAGIVKYAPRMFRLLVDSMVFKDDPHHKRLRSLVNKAFTPKRVQAMADEIQLVVDELVAELERKGTVDLVHDLAIPLPLRVISSMMGVGEEDRERFHLWVEKFTQSSGGANVTSMIKMMPTGRKMIRMFDRLAADRRRNPSDDLITALVRAQEGDDRLSDHEVIAMVFLLLLAGHDTTANLIGSSILTLLDHPEQMARLRDEPDLIGPAVEELLRFTTPVPCGAARIATEDLELGGFAIPKGGHILGMIISANRDEAVFDRPDELDLGRIPNKHITFAFGSHYCLGNQLARMEGQMAISALVQRFPDMRLAIPKDQLRYKPTESLRGLRSLPLVLA